MDFSNEFLNNLFYSLLDSSISTCLEKVINAEKVTVLG